MGSNGLMRSDKFLYWQDDVSWDIKDMAFLVCPDGICDLLEAIFFNNDSCLKGTFPTLPAFGSD